MSTLRIGLVGAGFAAQFHFESLQHVHGVDARATAVTSLRKQSREAFARDHGLEAYDSVEAMLEHVDVVDIVSPPAAHDEAILAAAAAGKHIICEKPFSGYFGPEGAGEDFRGDTAPKGPMLEAVQDRLARLAEAIRAGQGAFGYAENFVYAPAVQKEREIVEKTGAQLLRQTGEESHSGSHSKTYGVWRLQGGGSLMGKACHPLGAVLYLKRIEGLAGAGRPIRPKTVTARCERLTELPGFRDAGFLRTGYHDSEDHGWMHLTFEDGTIADVTSGEIVLGGIYNYLDVFANNHRTRCNLSPIPMLETFNPRGAQFEDIYTVEKIGTKEGWTQLTPDENYTLGYIAEMQDFVECMARGRRPQSDLDLALDTIAAIYAGYASDEARGAEQEVPLL